MIIKRLFPMILLTAASLLAVTGCEEPTTSPTGTSAAAAERVPPPQQLPVLWGSSSDSPVNAASLFTIDQATGDATYIGSNGLSVGNERIAGLDIDPTSGTIYGIKGGPCYGALLVTLDPFTGAATLVDTLKGGWFDGTPGPNCPGGSAAIAFAADGTLYASGWYGGIPQGKIMRVDKTTATVLEVYPTPLGFDDWRGRRAHLNGLAFDANGTLWASRGNSVTRAEINTVDYTTGNITGTLYLNDPVMEDSLTISDLSFGPDGKLYASLPWESMLAEIDTATGDVTRIGPFGAAVTQIAGLTALPRAPAEPLGRYWLNEATAGQGPTAVLDDRPAPIDLPISYTPELVWTESGGHRGLASTDFNHSGTAVANVEGTKYENSLDGSTQMTMEAVVSFVQPPYTATIVGFQDDKRISRRAAVLLVNTDGQPVVQVRTQQQNTISVVWPVDLADGVRRVLHAVYNADDPTDYRRIRLYVDGVDQGAGQLEIGNWPGAGETLRFKLNGLSLHLMNYVFILWYYPIQGTLHYFAVYDTALNDLEIAFYVRALLADDDNL